MIGELDDVLALAAEDAASLGEEGRLGLVELHDVAQTEGTRAACIGFGAGACVIHDDSE